MGGILSSLVVFFCLKNQYTSKKSVPPSIVTKVSQKQVSTKKTKTIEKVLKTPSLYFKSKKNITLNINEKEKKDFESILKLLDNNYTKKIIFSNDIKDSSWSEIAKNSIKYFYDNNITDATIEANSSNIKIYAIFQNKTKYEDFTKLLKHLENNNTNLENHIKWKKKVKNIKIVNTSNIQNKINKFLNKNPLYFKFASNILTDKSKKTLDSIVKILNSKKLKYNITIQGHTDAQGNEVYNKKLSQQRANSVKKYLLSHLKNINKISSQGFGSSKPKYKNKKDKRNRRVEIIINKGFE